MYIHTHIYIHMKKMNNNLLQLANSISRTLISTSKTWNPRLEKTLHKLNIREKMSAELVARVIDPGLLPHHSLSLGFFNWASQQPNFLHSHFTYNSILKSLSYYSNNHNAIENILKEAKTRKIEVDSSVYNAILENFVRFNKCVNAYTVFREVGFEIGVKECNILLSGLSSDGKFVYASKVFEEMNEKNIFLSTLGFGVYLWRFSGNVGLDEIFRVLDEGKGGFWGVNGSILAVLIVHGLCLNNRVKDAFLVLDELRKRECKPDFIAYRVLAEAFRLNGYVVEVETVLKKKRKLGVAPRAKDYREFLLELIYEKRYWEAKELGGVIVSGNFPIDEDVLNGLIESVSVVYPSSGLMFLKFMVEKEMFPGLVTLRNFSMNLCKHGKIDDLLEVFELLSSKEYFTDLGSYSVMVWCLCEAGKVKEAYEVIECMKKKGLVPDVSIYNYIIEACCREGLVRPAKKLWDEMFTSGCSADVTTYNILIKKFSETGHVKEARGLFSRMLEKGVVPNGDTYTFLLEGLCKGKQVEDALEIFSMSVRQDPRLTRSLLNPFIILLCEEGYFGAASKLLCGLGAGIEQSDSHIILLKWLLFAGDVALAIQHVTLIGQISATLLQELRRELEAIIIPSVSSPSPVRLLLKAVEDRL